MNSSLISVSFHSGDPLPEGDADSENESEASNYIDYLDNFNRNFDRLDKPGPEQSESHSILKNEGTLGEEDINFDEDSSPDPPGTHSDNPLLPEGNSFLGETRREHSILNKNISMINLNVIPEEHDVSFAFNKNFLSLLNEEREEESEGDQSPSELEDLPNPNRLERYLQPKTPTKALASAESDSLYPRNALQGIQTAPASLEVVVRQSGHQETVYRVTPAGLEGSTKSTNCPDIIVGRADAINENCPNDIILQSENKVSQIHLRIVTRYFFRLPTGAFRKFLVLLFCLKRRPRRPNHFLLSQILPFLRKPHEVLVQDLGTLGGTFRRLPPSSEQLLTPHVEFKLGDEAFFQVVLTSLFLDSICQLKRQQPLNFVNTTFLGFTNIEEEVLKGDTERLAFLVLQTKNCPSSVSRFLILNPLYHNRYIFGRGEKSDVVINLGSVSRRQATIFYDERGWILQDGFAEVPSKNGCWISIRNTEGKRQCGPKVVLRSSDELMIGNTIVQFRFPDPNI
jgi:hypothetical protein